MVDTETLATIAAVTFGALTATIAATWRLGVQYGRRVEQQARDAEEVRSLRREVAEMRRLSGRVAGESAGGSRPPED